MGLREPEAWVNGCPRSLSQNFWSVLIGNIGYAGCQWGMVVVLAKLCSPESVGQFALGYAIAAPVFMLSGLQLRSVQATDASEEYLFGDYLGLRVIGTSLALATIAIVSYAAGYGRETSSIILVISLAKGVESVSDAFYGVFHQRQRMDRIAFSTLARGLLSLGALAVLTYATRTVLWGTLGMCFAGAAVLVFYDMPTAARMLTGENGVTRKMLPLRPHWDTGVLWKMAKLTLPLGVVAMLLSLNMNVPRYFISKELGESELGIFSALAYLMTPGLTIVVALGQAAVPRLAALFARGDHARYRGVLLSSLLAALGVGVAGVVAVAVAGQKILSLLYTPAYAKNSPVLVCMLAAGGFYCITSVLGTAVTSMRVFRLQLAVQVLCSLVVLIFSWLLIARMGLMGAALSLLASSITSTAAYGLIVVRKLAPYSALHRPLVAAFK